MQIVEVKNNLVKVSYDTSQENLILSGFLMIKDSIQSFIGQIIHLDSNSKGNFVIVKLLFNFDDNGVIKGYNGSIPNVKSLVDVIYPQELLELLPVQTPINMGELAQQGVTLNIDASIFEKKLLVCCEKDEDNKILINNFVSHLTSFNKNVLVFDLNGDSILAQNKIIAGQNFKLPLNYETINFIYDNLDDAKAETKALIQEVFLEVQNYVKTLPQGFIPFKSFKEVVDEQYEELELVELVLLKNKLLKYYEQGIFAQDQNEFDSLKFSLENNKITVFDLSKINEKIQREMISYAYDLINKLNTEIYVILNISDSNSDKKLLKQVFMAKNAFTTLICPYSYKYLKELKQISKNLILFTPIQQQNDFAGYNSFLNKLNSHEFIVYGQSTQNIPLIVKLQEVQKIEEINPQPGVENLLDEEIRRDVDRIYTAQKPEEVIDEQVPEIIEESLTEEDLDFIDEVKNDFSTETVEEELIEEKIEEEIVKEKNESVPEIEEIGFEEIIEEETIQPLDSSTVQQVEPPPVDILPASIASTPIVPVYSADIEKTVDSDSFEQGDEVMHAKYGKGVVEKLISYGSKTLCSINFDNVGRRLLDPTLAEIKKI